MMRRALPTMLALWLLLPTLAGIWVDRHAPGVAAPTVSVLAVAAWVFALPLLALGTARALFLFWMPVAFLAPLQCYLIYFFGSVPGDAITASAMQLNLAQTIELLAGFGWLVLLLPIAWAAYVLLWRRLDRTMRLSVAGRKSLAAYMLMYAAVGLLSEQDLGHYVAIPPLFNEALASATFPAGSVLSLSRVHDAEQAAARTPMVALHATAPATPQVVILVIGESVRPDHLGINGYHRNTTPELSRIGPDLMSFSDVASTTNYTAGAVPNIVRRAVDGGNVSLISLFREAGFHTAWLSNQQLDVFHPDADLSDFSQKGWHETFRQDSDLLPMLAACLKQCGARQLIVLHMYGSHFPYDARYGRRDQVYSPIFRDAGFSTAAPQFKQELINSYDNTLFGADRFLSAVIAHAGAAGKPALVLYTSDHGENLYDDERQLFMHIGPHPSRGDTMVPMLFWANHEYERLQPDKVAAMRNSLDLPVNHLAILPTLLDLGGVDYDGKDPALSLASGQYKPIDRKVSALGHAGISVSTLH